MRTKKQPGVLELLGTFVEDYMPVAAGLSMNTIHLYKASFRLLLNFFYDVKEIAAEKITFQDLNRETISSLFQIGNPTFVGMFTVPNSDYIFFLD